MFSPKKTKKFKHKNNNKFIYSNFPHDWLFYEKPQNKFFGSKISKKNYHLFSITRNNQYKLNFNISIFKKLSLIENYVVLEGKGSIANIIQSYFFSGVNKKNICNKLNIIFKNKFISNLIAQGIADIEIPKNKVFLNNLEKFCTPKNKIKKIMHSIPEFIDGRIINKFFETNKIDTFSLQHSSIGVLQYPRFISMIKIISKIDNKYLSNNILVENSIISKQLSNIKSKVHIVGSHRVKRIKNLHKINSRNIYYIAEMHNINQLPFRVTRLNEIFKNKLLFIRFHPGKKNIKENLIKKLEGFNKCIFVDNETNLFKSLQKIKPLLVFTSSPTVYRELILNNIKVVLIRDCNFFTNYPIDINYKKIIQTSEFIDKDYKKEIHSVPIKFFGKNAENKIVKAYNG